MTLLERYLKADLAVGDLTVTTQDGRTTRYGDGSGPAVAARVTTPARGASP